MYRPGSRTPTSRSPSTAASDSHLDLGCAPYALYGVKYIGPVSLACVPTIRPVTHTLT